MQFNIPRPLRVCACVRVCVAPSPCRPMPPPCPPSHLEPPGLPLSPTSISPRLAPTLAGQDEHPGVHGHGWGVSERLGCSQHSPPAVPTLALPGCQPARGWQQGPRPVAAKLGGTASLVPAPPRGRGSWGPPPIPPSLPFLPAGGDEVRLAGGTGLLHLHNNLVNGAWPAGEPGWRRHPLPAPLPPSGPAAPPAAARGAERSAGRAAGRAPPGQPSSSPGQPPDIPPASR